MSEAIILYRGRGGVDPESLKPQVITNNGEYVVPVTGTYWIGAVGGGGGGGGSCVNAASGSGTYYGAGGTRGTLNSGSIALNAGDRITMSLGAGGAAGTSNTTKIQYSNGCNNSMGISGSTGSTTTFGSYRAGSGGSGGSRAWSYQWWSNINRGWVNQNLGWSNTITGWTPVWSNKQETTWLCGYCRAVLTYDAAWDAYRCPTHNSIAWGSRVWGTGWNNVIIGNNPQWHNYVRWSNYVNWSNTKQHSTSTSYTGIQQGTWWYQATNNQVSTSGTRTYRGDGGASGRAGNAGFIVIIPPTI